ncbi:MAG: metallophosphoesterase family protein [Phycisphaerales bacterium]|jgi:predicted phosphodiesterase
MSRTLILSDIHFCKRGSSVNSVEQLRPLWQGYDELILNGDTSELHCAQHTEKAEEAVAAIKAMTDEDDVQLTLICGNHDPTISDLEHKWYCNKQVLVFHGHAPIFGGAPWSWRYKHFAESHASQLQGTGDGFDEQLSAVRTASIQSATGEFNEHKPSTFRLSLLVIPSIIKILKCWKRYPTYVSKWANQFAPTAKFIITGHTHHAGIWNREDKVIINTGCYGFPSHPRAVEIDGNKITVYKIYKRKHVYTLGSECASWKVL